MGEFLPDYLIREQAAVGALVVFGVLRVIGAVMAFQRGWRISTVEKCFLAAAVIYCAPQLFDLLTQLYGCARCQRRTRRQGERLRDRAVLRADPRSQAGLRISGADRRLNRTERTNQAPGPVRQAGQTN